MNHKSGKEKKNSLEINLNCELESNDESDVRHPKRNYLNRHQHPPLSNQIVSALPSKLFRECSVEL